METRVAERANRLYDAIDASGGYYSNSVDPSCRSRMNVPFRVRGGDRDIEARFIADAEREVSRCHWRRAHDLAMHSSRCSFSPHNAVHGPSCCRVQIPLSPSGVVCCGHL